jgi:hypothetical protein
VRNDIGIKSTSLTSENNIEVLTVEIDTLTVTSVYKPPLEPFSLKEPDNFTLQPIQIVMGDFNCHSTTWGYSETDENGERLEAWAEKTGLKLIHDPKQPPSFNSGRWRKGYNPDNIWVSDRISQQATKLVLPAVPRTQHRPIMCLISAAIRPESVPFKRRFNFKKADWVSFSSELDRKIVKLEPAPESYYDFVSVVGKISRRHIPRGCRTEYVAGLSADSKELLETYQDLYETDPFSEETIQAGEAVLQAVSECRTERWCKLLSDLDMRQNSRRAWKLIKNLENDPTTPTVTFREVTPDQIAHQILFNGKIPGKKARGNTLPTGLGENSVLDTPFTVDELENSIQQMKDNKAAGFDDIRTEHIKRFGSATLVWITELMNRCVATNQMPKVWRKSRIIALLKPG